MTQSHTVSLHGVLAAAELGRAPVAAESAGYLALAIADQLLRAPMLVDEQSVSLAADGSVQLDGGRASSTVDAERAIRGLLSSLLSVAPSATPALGAAARRASGAGVGALVAELEGALIPVNRGAARRALARLARDTNRLADSGVSLRRRARPAPPPEPTFVAARAPEPVVAVVAVAAETPPPRALVTAAAPPMTAIEVVEATPLPPAPEELTDPCAAIEFLPSDAPTTVIAASDVDDEPPVDVAPERTAPLPFGADAPPPARYEGRGPLCIIVPPPTSGATGAPASYAVESAADAPLETVPSPVAPTTCAAPDDDDAHPEPTPAIDVELASLEPPVVRTRSRVDELLEAFRPTDGFDERALSKMLKSAAGLEPTPPPPGVELAEDDDAPSHGDLARALPDSSAAAPARPLGGTPPGDDVLPRRPRAPRLGSALLGAILFCGVVALIAAWVRFPWLFTGRIELEPLTKPPVAPRQIRFAVRRCSATAYFEYALTSRLGQLAALCGARPGFVSASYAR